jgi:hypothetical protein
LLFLLSPTTTFFFNSTTKNTSSTQTHPTQQTPHNQPGAMSSSYHIPFPRSFLAVNTPVKKSGSVVDAATAAVQSQQFDHGFLSNRPANLPRHASISSTSSSVSEAAIGSAPPSPPTIAAASPVFAAKSFTPLALNSKHATFSMASIADMTPVARSAFLSNR